MRMLPALAFGLRRWFVGFENIAKKHRGKSK
jgi:hypothetical protein